MSASFLHRFATLEDPRVERNQRHALLDIVLLAVCAVASGAQRWEAIEDVRPRHRAGAVWGEQSVPDLDTSHENSL